MPDAAAAGLVGAALAIGLILARVIESLLARRSDRRQPDNATLLVELATTAGAIKDIRDDVADVKKAVHDVGTAIIEMAKSVAIHEWRLADIDKRVGALERKANGEGGGE